MAGSAGSAGADNRFLVDVANPVPAGSAYVGSWIFDATLNRFRRPKDCGAVGRTGEELGANRRLMVSEFWLSKTPITNQYYGYCVADGACSAPEHDIADPNSKSWDDSARTELPVYVRKDQADDYCTWAHGRLPTVAELTRAAQGDAEVPGIAALTQAVIDCASEVAGSAAPPTVCGQLKLMNFFQNPSPPLYRTNAVDLDHGPYGHADLFGSVWELTQSFGGFSRDADFCALADGSPDFVTFDPGGNADTSDVISFASPLLEAVATASSQSVGSVSAQPIMALPNSISRYNIGFRCAFDTAQ